ncbi:MAG: L-aspartate oxidase, partial [Acidobacteriota bacterium]
MKAIHTDFLVIGSGIAGLSFALEVAGERSVAIVTKKESAESATNYAQGGVAAVMSSRDSFESHVSDTLKAGAGLCRETVVRHVIERGPEAIRRLMELGVVFDRKEGTTSLDLGREGGHSARRVLHAADLTGRAIERALVRQAEGHPAIRMFQNHLAVDLVTSRQFGRPEPCRVYGAYILDAATGDVETFAAPVVLLATGGCGKVYLYTSNPEIASGDGIAMAYRAGAPIANMEFIQFHPTCLYHPQARSFLISEAVRGEGAFLVNEKGEKFMARHHERADLAPRDIVARAIDLELKRSGADCVYLDCTEMEPRFLRRR